MRAFEVAVLFLILSLSSTGCKDDRWPDRYPARTKVLFEGVPPVGATIVLYPADRIGDPSVVPSRGVVGEDGTVSFTTYMPDDGVPAGEYLVSAFWVNLNGPPSANKLPERYRDPQTSGCRIRIEKRSNELDTIVLTK